MVSAEGRRRERGAAAIPVLFNQESKVFPGHSSTVSILGPWDKPPLAECIPSSSSLWEANLGEVGGGYDYPAGNPHGPQCKSLNKSVKMERRESILRMFPNQTSHLVTDHI